MAMQNNLRDLGGTTKHTDKQIKKELDDLIVNISNEVINGTINKSVKDTSSELKKQIPNLSSSIKSISEERSKLRNDISKFQSGIREMKNFEDRIKDNFSSTSQEIDGLATRLKRLDQKLQTTQNKVLELESKNHRDTTELIKNELTVVKNETFSYIDSKVVDIDDKLKKNTITMAVCTGIVSALVIVLHFI